MPRKTDSPPKRMRETRDRGPKLTLPSSVQGYSPEQLERHWGMCARFILTVEDAKDVSIEGMTVQFRPSARVDYFAKARRRLFEHFRLDPNDPLHWRQLVDYFAYIEFWKGPPKKRGRPPEWTEAREADLAAAVATLPSQANAKLGRHFANHKTSPFQTNGKSGRGLRSRIAKVKKSLTNTGT